MNALRPAKSRSSDPYGFFAAGEPGAAAPDTSSLEDLLRRLLPPVQPAQSPASRLSEMMRQDYAPPAPAVPDYPPIRGAGYRIPIIQPPDTAGDPLDSVSGYGGGKRQLPAASLSGAPPLEPPIDLGPDRPIYRLGPIPPAPKPERGIVPSATRIGKAASGAVQELFEPPLGISRESLGSLVAQTPEEARGAAGLIRGFNEMLLRGGSTALDAASRAMLAPIVGGIAAVGQAAQEAGMSQTDARRLERDLHALAVSLGVVTGAAMGGRPGVPRPERILAEADARGMFDSALRDLPRDARLAAKQKLREAFTEGREVGDEAAAVRRDVGTRTTVGASTAATADGSALKPRVGNLPAESRTINPLTLEEFRKLPESGTVDPHRIRTVQDSVKPMFKENADEKTSRSLLDTIDELRTTPNKSSEIEPIRIFELNGNVYTLDHRRLVAHRLADSPIRFRKATEAETRKELRRKFTTKDGGMTIQIR